MSRRLPGPARRAGGWRQCLAAALIGVACLLRASAAVAQEDPDVLVFVAASLRDALDAASEQYRAEGGGQVAVSYASSGTLARQIEQGAPADLFISADVRWMDELAERKLIVAATRTALLGNGLVLVAPRASGLALDIGPGFPLAKALGDGRLAIGNPAHVPAGSYAKAALRALGVWSAVEGRLAQADNVRAALALVARGEAPLGIVYRSDAFAEPEVRIVDVFPADSHPPIVYPAAIIAESRHPEAGRFLEFLQTPEAMASFERFGFTMLR